MRKTPPTSGGIAADVESDDTRRKATANATGNAEEVPTRLFANRDAERALLGYLIDHPDAVTSMPIEVDLFSVPDHRRTYDAIVDLATSRGTVDSIVLGNELRRRGVPEPGYLVAVLRESGGLDVTGLVRVLKECATRRRIHTCARALQAGAFDPTKHVDDLLAEMVDLAESTSARVDRSLWMVDDETILAEPAERYLVEGILPAGALGLIVGKSGDGKTFLALDLAFSIASGTPWHGREVAQGRVLYIAAEGQHGLARRIRAWKTRHGMIGMRVGVHFMPQPLDPLDDTQITALLAHLRRLPEAPVLLVIDTWSLCLAAGGGDEDKAKDVNGAIVRLKRLIQELGTTVLLVHHEGHTATGRARGSSALRAAVETEIVVTKKADVITVKNTKQRDIAPFADIKFRLCVQEVDGPSSCVLEPVATLTKIGAPTKNGLSEKEWKALATLRRFGESGVTFTKWQTATELAETTFRRSLTKLEGDGYVAKLGVGRGAIYYVTDTGRDYRHHGHDTANGRDGGEHTTATHRHTPIGVAVSGGDGGDDGDLAGGGEADDGDEEVVV